MGLTGILPAIDLLPVLAALAFAYVGALNGEADAKPASYYGIGDPVRLRMLRLALAGQPHYEIDQQEISRGGVSYSIDTVHDYRRRFPGAELFYLIGADHVPTLPKWREADDLAQLVEFIVIPRPGEAPAPADARFRVRRLGGWPMQLSSSEIRARAGEGKTIAHLVPAGVAEVIQELRLYEPPTQPRAKAT